MSKDLRITTEEQVEINRVNIESQIVLTDKNTTDIASNKLRIELLENDDTAIEEIGDLNDLETTFKDNLVGAINEVDALAKTSETKNQIQDIQIAELQGIINTSGATYGKYTTSGVVATTPIFIKNVVVETPIDNTDLAEVVETATATIFRTKVDAFAEIIYQFNATQAVGDRVDLFIQLVNNTTGADLGNPQKISLDFAGNINVSSGIRAFTNNIVPTDIAIKVYTSTGSVTINDATIDFKVTSNTTAPNVVYDSDVTSTNILDGTTATVKADIAWLNSNKASLIDFMSLQNDVLSNTASITTLTSDLSSLTTRVDGTETSITQLQLDLNTTNVNVSTNATNISTNTNDIGVLRTDVNNLVAEDVTINAKLDEIYNQLVED